MKNHAAVANEALRCYHCQETCTDTSIRVDEKHFCCEGCRSVYQILQQSDLCTYYDLNNNPGINQRMKVRKDKFAFLDTNAIRSRLIDFEDDTTIHTTFYLPQMHCSSCLYLLENLHRIEPGVVSSKVNFARKEVTIVFQKSAISLRQIAELLTSIGYEPYISLNDLNEKRPLIDKSMIYQVGVAGFCFGNIMLLSFPDYLGIDASDLFLRNMFRYVTALLALPVLLYASQPFFRSAWAGLRHKVLNIDAPIALAILITFVRSCYEVFSGNGGGYFDSMSGIVFFMLAGRILQNKTYRQLSFDRDYASYFPIAVTVVKDDTETIKPLPELTTGDTLLIHNNELIPADGILTRGKAYIDYSFVTGESQPVVREVGELVYAGGRQTGTRIEILAVKEVAQSYLTRLWNNAGSDKEKTGDTQPFVQALGRYFSYIVFGIALITALYWLKTDPQRAWPAVTAIFIVACPCALLLSSTFTNGHILRLLGHHSFYLKNAGVIQEIGNIDHIVFDKTGTLTDTRDQEISYEGDVLANDQQVKIAALVACSTHPLSKALAAHLPRPFGYSITNYHEVPGQGIEGVVNGSAIRIGSAEFTGVIHQQPGTTVTIRIDDALTGVFKFRNLYRDRIIPLLKQLGRNYKLTILSGDNNNEEKLLRSWLGDTPVYRFNQAPGDKLNYIRALQQEGQHVMMVGDGLNDAGALRQANAGIAVTDQANNFTPASDGILRASQLPRLATFIRICKANRRIIIASFILSILYNIIGLSFAVQGTLSPLIAAILMPLSSISILLLTWSGSQLLGRRLLSHSQKPD